MNSYNLPQSNIIKNICLRFSLNSEVGASEFQRTIVAKCLMMISHEVYWISKPWFYRSTRRTFLEEIRGVVFLGDSIVGENSDQWNHNHEDINEEKQTIDYQCYHAPFFGNFSPSVSLMDFHEEILQGFSHFPDLHLRGDAMNGRSFWRRVSRSQRTLLYDIRRCFPFVVGENRRLDLSSLTWSSFSSSVDRHGMLLMFAHQELTSDLFLPIFTLHE